MHLGNAVSKGQGARGAVFVGREALPFSSICAFFLANKILQSHRARARAIELALQPFVALKEKAARLIKFTHAQVAHFLANVLRDHLRNRSSIVEA